MKAVRTAIKASLSPREICHQHQISLATYFRIKAAGVRHEAAEKSPHRSAPRPSKMQIERLCRVFPDTAERKPRCSDRRRGVGPRLVEPEHIGAARDVRDARRRTFSVIQ